MLAVAAIVRIAWILHFHPTPTDGRFDDTAWYRGAAHYFAEGAGYVNPFTNTPTAAWPPGYPVTLGVVFKIFGEGNWTTYCCSPGGRLCCRYSKSDEESAWTATSFP